MKTLTRTLLVACTLAVPALSFAQGVQGPLTRAEVRADLIRVEKAGFHPGVGEDANYPQDIQAAEAMIAAEDAARTTSMNQTPSQPAMAAPMTRQMASMHYRIDNVRSPFYYGA